MTTTKNRSALPGKIEDQTAWDCNTVPPSSVCWFWNPLNCRYIHEIVTSWRNQFIFELNLPGRVGPRLLHRVAFMHRRLTYRCFYTQTLLHREAFAQTIFFHIDAFVHRNCLVQTEAFTHAQKTTVYTAYRKRYRSFYTRDSFAQRPFYTQLLLHPDAFTERNPLHLHRPAFAHRCFYTKRILHRETFANRRLYAQNFFTQMSR